MKQDIPSGIGRFKTLLGVFAFALITFLADPRAALAGPRAPALPGGQASSVGQEPPEVPGAIEESSPRAKIARKQRQEFLRQKFEKMKREAEELTSLANSLQDELDKSSENILSLQIVDKAEKIEKLAKQIKNSAKGD
ncbi:MAG: hypothetical protein LAN62_12255 [Acidobacteriia bacterium]|nr:hypothetical protein [Terriglobia bacterium]